MPASLEGDDFCAGFEKFPGTGAAATGAEDEDAAALEEDGFGPTDEETRRGRFELCFCKPSRSFQKPEITGPKGELKGAVNRQVFANVFVRLKMEL